MRFTHNKYLPYYIIALLAAPLFWLNIYGVHPWGDDFSQYIKEALNIAQGKPYYRSGYIYNPYNTEYAPPQYPPGYPVLLAPIVGIWGISYTAMAYFNTCITVLLYFTLFAYFRKRAGMVSALCLATTIIYSSYILYLKANVLSDTLCLLFIMLYLLYRNGQSFSKQRILLLAALAAAAMLTRSQAILLPLAELLFFIISTLQKAIKYRVLNIRQSLAHPLVAIVTASLLLFSLVNGLIFPTPLTTSSFYNQFIHRALSQPLINPVKDNLSLLASQIAFLFHYDTTAVVSKELISLIEGAATVFCMLGFILTVKKKLLVDEFFFLLMCLLTLYLPVHDVRYFLPAMALAYFYTFVTLKTLAANVTPAHKPKLALALSLLYLYTGSVYLKKIVTEVPDGCIPQEKELTAFRYISRNINDSSIIVFTKPRLLTLYTGKRTINAAWQESPEKNKEIFDSLHVQYMLTVDGLDDKYFKTYLHTIQHPIDSTIIAAGYTLYRVR